MPNNIITQPHAQGDTPDAPTTLESDMALSHESETALGRQFSQYPFPFAPKHSRQDQR